MAMVLHQLCLSSRTVFVSILVSTCIWTTGESATCIQGTDPIALVSELRRGNVTSHPQISSLQDHTPREVRLNRDGWCSETLLNIVYDPYIQFNFNDTYAVYYFEFGGANGSYVEEFQIETAIGDGPFEFFRDSSGNTVFNTTLSSSTDNRMVFENSSVGFPSQTLRILPYSWSSNPLCMRLEIYGCIADPESIVTMPTATPTTKPTATLATLVLQIALPISLITLALVVIISVISVSLCWFIKRHYYRKLQFAQSTMEMSIEDNRTIKHVKNQLYQSSDMEQSSASTTQIINKTKRKPVVPRPYEVATSTTKNEPIKGDDVYYSPVNPNPPDIKFQTKPPEVGGETNAGYEIVESRGTIDSTSYAVVSRRTSIEGMLGQTRPHDVGESQEIQSPSLLSANQYLNVSMSPQDRGFGMSESLGPEHFQV